MATCSRFRGCYVSSLRVLTAATPKSTPNILIQLPQGFLPDEQAARKKYGVAKDIDREDILRHLPRADPGKGHEKGQAPYDEAD